MKYFLFLLFGALSLALGAALVGGIASSLPERGPVYAVAALQTHLAHEPAAWVNRTVRVRAIANADGCSRWSSAERPTCLEWQALLFDPGADAKARPLPLARGPVSPLLVALRRAPFLSRLAPSPQKVVWDATATYRIRLRAVPCRPGGSAPCGYAALLLDAAPFAS
jgi:hypothetical protein